MLSAYEAERCQRYGRLGLGYAWWPEEPQDSRFPEGCRCTACLSPMQSLARYCPWDHSSRKHCKSRHRVCRAALTGILQGGGGDESLHGGLYSPRGPQRQPGAQTHPWAQVENEEGGYGAVVSLGSRAGRGGDRGCSRSAGSPAPWRGCRGAAARSSPGTSGCRCWGRSGSCSAPRSRRAWPGGGPGSAERCP